MEQGRKPLADLPQHRIQKTAQNFHIHVANVDALQLGQGNSLLYITSSDTENVDEDRQHGGESEVKIMNENNVQINSCQNSFTDCMVCVPAIQGLQQNRHRNVHWLQSSQSVTKGDKLVSVLWRNDTWDNESPTMTELKINFLKDGKTFDTKELELEIFNIIREENNVRLRKLITELIATFNSQLEHVEIGCIKLVVSSKSTGLFEKLQDELKDLLHRTIIPESAELCIDIRTNVDEQPKSTFDRQSKQESAFKLRQGKEELQAMESPDLDKRRNLRKELSDLPFNFFYDSSHIVHLFKTFYRETDCQKRLVEEFENFCTIRVGTIHVLYDTADDLDKVAKNIRISKIAGSSVGIASTGLIVGGIVSGVFTMGVGFVLTAVGAGLGAASAATSIGATIADSVISKTRRDQINDALVKDTEALKTLSQKLEVETNEDENTQGDAIGASSESKPAMFSVVTSRVAVTVNMGYGPAVVISVMSVLLDVATLVTHSKDVYKHKSREMAERFRAIAKQLTDNLRDEVLPGLLDIIERSRE